MSQATKWVATVTGSGMGIFHVEADTLEQLEHDLGDLQDTVGRIRWGVAEHPSAWGCDGGDGCATPPQSQPPSPEADQLGFDL
jgi:hypothetical protein